MRWCSRSSTLKLVSATLGSVTITLLILFFSKLKDIVAQTNLLIRIFYILLIMPSHLIGLSDEALKAFVIKRYRKSLDESSETMVTVAASGDSQIHSCKAFIILLITKANHDILICSPDEVLGTRLLNHRLQDLGESSENVIADSSEGFK